MWSVYSDDDGASWSRPSRTALWGFPADILQLQDGRVLAVYGHRRDPFGVHGCISEDGVHWPKEHEFVIKTGGAMWASPEVRGKGVGRALLHHVLIYLQDQGCHKIKLTVTETNTTAISLYEGQGFKMTGAFEPLRDGSKLKNLEMARVNK